MSNADNTTILCRSGVGTVKNQTTKCFWHLAIARINTEILGFYLCAMHHILSQRHVHRCLNIPQPQTLEPK